MDKKRKIGILSKVALFGAAIIWGSSFFIVKNTVDVFTPNILLGFRFTIGCLFLAVIFRNRLKAINKDDLKKSGIIGFCLFIAYSVQTIGLTDTTPGKNAFLTAIYCVIVPFLFWAVDRVKPNKYNFIAAIICIAGIGMVSLTGDLTIGFGDGLTLISGFFYAAHIVAVAKFSKGKDPVVITILQFGYAAIFSWIAGFTFESLPTVWTLGSLVGVLYLAIFATAVALLLQNIGQKYSDPSSAAIILSLESVFGVLFSIVFYGEKITVKLLLGFAVIFAAVIISETKLSFLSKEKIEEDKEGIC